MRRMIAMFALALCLGVGLVLNDGTATLAATSEAVASVAWGDRCMVWNDTYAYLYGDPPYLRGTRSDYDDWTFNMSQQDCVSNLAQVRVKQWGAEMCSLWNAEFVILRWNWNYYPGGGGVTYGSLEQQYDCNDLP